MRMTPHLISKSVSSTPIWHEPLSTITPTKWLCWTQLKVQWPRGLASIYLTGSDLMGHRIRFVVGQQKLDISWVKGRNPGQGSGHTHSSGQESLRNFTHYYLLLQNRDWFYCLPPASITPPPPPLTNHKSTQTKCNTYKVHTIHTGNGRISEYQPDNLNFNFHNLFRVHYRQHDNLRIHLQVIEPIGWIGSNIQNYLNTNIYIYILYNYIPLLYTYMYTKYIRWNIYTQVLLRAIWVR